MKAGFALTMALREWRAHPGTLAFFSFSVALGVACLVSTETLSRTLSDRIQSESRSLLGADIEVRSRQRLLPAVESELEAVSREGARLVRTVETLSMISSADRSATRLASLKAAGEGYPHYGSVVTEPPEAWSAFERHGHVLLAPALALQLGVGPGDTLLVGRRPMTVAGTLAAEPDRLAEPFQLGPRLMMRLRDLEGTELLAPGSRATYRALLALPPGLPAQSIERRLEAVSAPGELRMTRADEGPEGADRLMGRIGRFLDLSGLAVMLLAGVGTAMAVRTYVGQRIDTLAVLRCLGARSSGLLLLMGMQTLLLAGAGTLLGAIAGVAAAERLPRLVEGTLPFPIVTGFYPGVVARGMATGLLVTLAFSVPSLLGLRRLSVAQVFRREVDPQASRRRRLDPAAAFSFAALLFLVALLAWERAGEAQLAAYFLGGFAAALGTLAAAAHLMVSQVHRAPMGRRFDFRQAVANIRRPGNQSAPVIVAVGLGVFLVMLVHYLQTSILDELATGLNTTAPNLFIIDIQQDQRAPMEELMAALGHPPEEVVPLVRSRLARIGTTPVDALYPDSKEPPWWITRDYWLTYRNHLTASEELVEGRFWGDAPGAAAARQPGEVSVEQRTADRFGVGVGDSLALNVQGLELPARVTSIRRVRWVSMRPNFFLLFPEGVLEQAPRTYFAVARVAELEERNRLSRELVERWPNLTIIDFTAAVGAMRQMLLRVSWVVYIVAALCLAGGGLVLTASILLTRRHRLHEMALLKLLGARRPVLVRIMAIEYALLGVVGGLFGAVAALAVAMATASTIFEITVQPSAGPVAAAAGLAMLFSVLCGALASAGILRHPPSEILRRE